MLLYMKGVCRVCSSREVTYEDNGKSKTFTAHRCRMIDPSGDFDPMYVDTGEVPLERGKVYVFPVRVSTYTNRKGETRLQYNTYKDFPPQEVPITK